MFPCTSHGDAALLELPRGGRRPAFLCNSTALLVSLSLSFRTSLFLSVRLWLLVHRMAIKAHKSYLPQCRKSSAYNGVFHTYTRTRSVSHSLYVNKVPLDSLCSPSCFHPICPQSVAASPGPNTNTRWHDQEQQQWVIVHLMHSWGG